MILILRPFIIPASSLLWEAYLEIFLELREILKTIWQRLRPKASVSDSGPQV